MKININGKDLKLKEGEYTIKVREKYFEVFNKNNNTIYIEDLYGNWELNKYINYNGNEEMVYCEDSDGFVEKWTRNKEGKVTYYQSSIGYWDKKEYNSNGKVIYHEDSTNGIIFDKRNKKVELTLDKIAERFGVEVKDLRIVK